ncbi:glycosyltransferase family 4 protein [Modestobacter sp. URMC 112]
MLTGEGTRVLHLAAYLNRVGGVASVVSTYVDTSGMAGLAHRARSTVDGRWLLPVDGATFRALAALLAGGRDAGDIAHIHMTQRGSLLREGTFARISQMRGLPIVVTIHGSSFPRFARRHLRVVRWALGPARAVLCLTDEAASIVRGLNGRAQVLVVDNPVDTRVGAARCSNAEPTALFLGEIGLRKGIDRLAAAWAEVVTAVPEAHLILAGPVASDGRAHLAELLQLRGVSYRGVVGGAAARALIEESWLTVLPSRAEALPRALLETMAAGRTVVATDVGEIKSLVTRRTGVLVREETSLSEALRTVLSDADRADQLGSAARAFVLKRHALDGHLQSLAAVYASVLVAHRAAGAI